MKGCEEEMNEFIEQVKRNNKELKECEESMKE
jgi:hypothetical protein